LAFKVVLDNVAEKAREGKPVRPNPAGKGRKRPKKAQRPGAYNLMAVPEVKQRNWRGKGPRKATTKKGKKKVVTVRCLSPLLRKDIYDIKAGRRRKWVPLRNSGPGGKNGKEGEWGRCISLLGFHQDLDLSDHGLKKKKQRISRFHRGRVVQGKKGGEKKKGGKT